MARAGKALDTLRRLGSAVCREPLAHFTVLAALLFAVNALAVGDGRSVIRIDAATQGFLLKQKRDLLLRPLTPAEQAATIDAYVEDEILWREAKRHGLDDNGWLRRQLIQNMRALVSGEVASPTEAALRDFFAQNVTRFELPPTLDLEHAYFSDPGRVPPDALERLGGSAAAAPVGDIDPLIGHRFLTVNQDQLVGLLGAAAARAVLAIDDGAWHGPLPAARGVYFVRVVGRRRPTMPSLDAARPWVETLWAMEQQRQSLERALAGMRSRYRIVVDPPSDQAAN